LQKIFSEIKIFKKWQKKKISNFATVVGHISNSPSFPNVTNKTVQHDIWLWILLSCFKETTIKNKKGR